jgi:hypothetical protein
MSKTIDIQGLEKFTIREIIAMKIDRFLARPKDFSQIQFSEAIKELNQMKERLLKAHELNQTQMSDLMDSDGINTCDRLSYALSCSRIAA